MINSIQLTISIIYVIEKKIGKKDSKILEIKLDDSESLSDDSDFEYVENFEEYAEADIRTINVEGYFEKAFNFACSYFY